MKKVLILGAGMVAGPIVDYLMKQPDFHVTVATRTVSKAEKLIGGNPRGTARRLLSDDVDGLKKEISGNDLVVSLLPATEHLKVAEICLQFKKHLVTTSYVSDEMNALNDKAEEAGVLFLNECGLDPGIDHMSAKKIINDVHAKGGKLAGFWSYCGGLPAPDAKTTPWGYKFSWSPKAVVRAVRNPGKFMKEGEIIDAPPANLFDNPGKIEFNDIGYLEYYPNRNSLPYIDLYDIGETRSIFRGTFRYPGWCHTWKQLSKLGYVNDDDMHDLSGLSPLDFLRKLHPDLPETGIKSQLAAKLHIDEKDDCIYRLDWLGFFDDKPMGLEKGTAADVLTLLLAEKLEYGENERDMIVLHHEFLAEYNDQPNEKITSTLISYGDPNGHSAMALTVSMPAAVAVRMILEGKIDIKGVKIPVYPEIYDVILEELVNLGLEFDETFNKI